MANPTVIRGLMSNMNDRPEFKLVKEVADTPDTPHNDPKPLGATELEKRDREYIEKFGEVKYLQNHVRCLGCQESLPMGKHFHQLPDSRPQRPETWSAEAWDRRNVYGNANFHWYRPHGPVSELPFILKVSKTSGDEKGVYVDIGDESAERGSELSRALNDMLIVVAQTLVNSSRP